jgi:hypothetical protein
MTCVLSKTWAARSPTGYICRDREQALLNPVDFVDEIESVR